MASSDSQKELSSSNEEPSARQLPENAPTIAPTGSSSPSPARSEEVSVSTPPEASSIPPTADQTKSNAAQRLADARADLLRSRATGLVIAWPGSPPEATAESTGAFAEEGAIATTLQRERPTRHKSVRSLHGPGYKFWVANPDGDGDPESGDNAIPEIPLQDGLPFRVIAVESNESKFSGDLPFDVGQSIDVVGLEDHRFNYYGMYVKNGARREGRFPRRLVHKYDSQPLWERQKHGSDSDVNHTEIGLNNVGEALDVVFAVREFKETVTSSSHTNYEDFDPKEPYQQGRVNGRRADTSMASDIVAPNTQLTKEVLEQLAETQQTGRFRELQPSHQLLTAIGRDETSQVRDPSESERESEMLPTKETLSRTSSVATYRTAQSKISSTGPSRMTSVSSYRTAHSIGASSVSSFLTAPSIAPRSNRISQLARRGLRAIVETPYLKLVRERDLLEAPENMLDWSGRGQHVEFEMHEQVPLVVLEVVGNSKDAVVSEVQCRRIRLACKSMRCRPRRLPLEKVINEVQHLQRLRHLHIVQLVGTYVKGRTFAILMYPVANYNMETFLEHCGFVGTQVAHLGYEQVRCRESLREFFACLLHALQYIHKCQIKHRDIKPGNILVRGPVANVGYRVYICDFGISTFFQSEDNTQTEGPTELTPRYCAPEVSNYDSRGRAADIFSLGCVFLEMCTALCGESNEVFAEYRRLSSANGRDSSFQANLDAVQRWIKIKLCHCPSLSCPPSPPLSSASPLLHECLPPPHECPVELNARIVGVAERMVQLSTEARPSASSALSSLRIKVTSHRCDAEREAYESVEAHHLELSRPSALVAELPGLYVPLVDPTVHPWTFRDICLLSNYLAGEAKAPLEHPPFLQMTCRYVDFLFLVQQFSNSLESARVLLGSASPGWPEAEKKLASHPGWPEVAKKVSLLYHEITHVLETYNNILAMQLLLDLEDIDMELELLVKTRGAYFTYNSVHGIRYRAYNDSEEVWDMLRTWLGPDGKGNPCHRVDYLKPHLIKLLVISSGMGLSIKDIRESIQQGEELPKLVADILGGESVLAQGVQLSDA